MEYRVLENPNVPNELKGYVAAEAVRSAEARAKAEQDRREVRIEHEKQVKESVAAIEAEGKQRREREAEEARKKSRERFEADLRVRFLAATPGADESDWNRSKTAVIDEAMKKAALGEGPISLAKERLLKSGRYSSF